MVTLVILTCPLTPDTEEMINRDTLALMKPTAYLINVGRGGLINESDLVRALKSNQIAGLVLTHSARRSRSGPRRI